MVLRFSAASRGQANFMVSLSVEAELDSSPATQMNGRPSTMSLVMPSRFSRWGMSADMPVEAIDPIAHASRQQGRVASFMVKISPVGQVANLP